MVNWAIFSITSICWEYDAFSVKTSCILSATILNTCSTSSSDNSEGTKGLNFSNDILEAFLAAVPETPPCVRMVRRFKFGYL